MPCFDSTASYIPSGSPNQRQCVATASMPKRTRSSRAAVAITEALPPCELASTSLRRPARRTPSPVSTSTRSSVSADSVSVPGDRMCSFDLPIDWIGSTSTRNSAGNRRFRQASMPSAMATSVITGRCGPCCSVAATGRMAMVFSGSSPSKSFVVSSAQRNACPGTAVLRCRFCRQTPCQPPLSVVGWAKPRQRRAHVVAPSKKAWARP